MVKTYAAILMVCGTLAGCASPSQQAFSNGDNWNGCKLLMAAGPKNPREFTNAGWCYANGYYVETSREKAFAYWTLAARHGEPTARSNLAMNGQPVPADDIARSASANSANDAALGMMLLQASRPRVPPPPMPLNCTSFINGRIVNTTCN